MLRYFDDTFVVGVTILTVELVVPDADVGAGVAVAELDVADAALEQTLHSIGAVVPASSVLSALRTVTAQ